MARNWHCSECGGTNTQVGATASWDVEKQDWVLECVEDNNDNDYCFDCDTWATGEFRDVTDLKTAALVAINREQNKQKEETNDKCSAEHTDGAGYAAPC